MPILRLAIAIFAVTPLTMAQSGTYTLKVDVPIVSLDVTVTDAAGRIVDDLQARDFAVTEEGVEQKISNFSPISVPYHVLLLFDKSGSTKHKWIFMKRAVAGFISYLKPQDRVAAGTFEHEVEMLVPWTDARRGAVAAMDSLSESRPATGTTEFYRSVEQALRKEFHGIPKRRAMVVLTDGRDTSLYLEVVRRGRLLPMDQDRNFQRLYKMAKDRRIPVYFIAVNTDRNLEPNVTGGDEYRNLQFLFKDSPTPRQYLEQVRLRMEAIAEETGGRALFPRSLEEIIPLYEQIGRQLGTSYSIGYVPANPVRDGSFRKVVIRTRNDSHRVTPSRLGYYAR